MALVGFGDLKDQEIHALWDLEELKRLELRDKTTFEQMIREVQDVANAVSGEFTRVPPYNGLFAVQDNPDVEYGTFVGGGIQELTEYSVPDPYRGKTTGHMLPIKMFARSLGWTLLSLENRRRNQIEADLQVVIDDIRDHFQQRVLSRFFKMEAELVNETAGASVPFADGGTADATYVPLKSPHGVEFAYTHDHYLRTATNNDASLLASVKHLKEHGHEAPYDLLGAEADVAVYQAMDGWRAPEWPGIIYRDTSAGMDRAALEGTQEYEGYIETGAGIVRVKLLPRIPTLYYALFKAYGSGGAKAPMRMRIDENVGFGWQVMPGKYVNDPLSLAVLRSEFDFGIGGDRTNGVFVEIDASGDYASPTIS
jgi:hypothetical protein